MTINSLAVSELSFAFESDGSHTNQPHSSSLFSSLEGVDFGFKYTTGALLAQRKAQELLSILRDHSKSRAVSNCFPYKPWGWMPHLDRERFQNAPFIFQSCRNKNVCPVCARKHGAKSRRLLLSSLSYYFDHGYRVWSQTLEMGFVASLKAKDRYRIILRCFTELLKSSAIRRLRKRNRIAYYRVLEETLVQETWTPHIHVLWVFTPELSEQEIANFIDQVSRSWRAIRKSSTDTVSNERPLFAKPLEEQNFVITAWYLHKSFFLDGFESVDHSKRRVRPIDYLSEFTRTADFDLLDVWNQFEEAVFGLTKYKFSNDWMFVS